MVSLNNAHKEIRRLKDFVIGVYFHANTTYLIISIDEKTKTLDTINFTQFGAIQRDFNMPIIGHYQLFPDGKNMNEMLNSPFDWTEFISKFNKGNF